MRICINILLCDGLVRGTKINISPPFQSSLALLLAAAVKDRSQFFDVPHLRRSSAS